MTNDCLADTEFKGSQEENVFPAALVNIIGKVPVKRHRVVCYCKFTGNNSNKLDKDRISFGHPWLPG